MRLQIKTALRQVWRGPSTVQIGLDPRCGTVIDGLSANDRLLLEQLTAGLDSSVAVPPGSGPGPARGPGLVRLLGEAGVLVQSRAGRSLHARLGSSRERLAPDAAVWSVAHGHRGGDGWEVVGGRAHRIVEILGGGRIGLTLAATLAAAGVGRVQVRDSSLMTTADLAPATVAALAAPLDGQTQEQAADALVAGLGGTGRGPLGTSPASPSLASLASPAPDGDERPADLVVLIAHGAADAGVAQRLVATDVAHLSVVVREATIVVGPLVVPGAGACLRCLDLHRADRDPLWPRVLAQLLPARGPQEVASAQLAASLAALQVLGHLDGVHRPAALGATLEVELPDGLVSRREWPAHAACGCTWPPSAPQGPPPDPRRIAPVEQVRTGGAGSDQPQ